MAGLFPRASAMTKTRIEGRVNGNAYEIIGMAGNVISSVPLSEAKENRKLQAAIDRNGWMKLDG